MHTRILKSALILGLLAPLAQADTIPEPDMILYGHVCLAGGPAGDSSDVVVTSRTTVGKSPVDVGRYEMGDQPSASDCSGSDDCFVLRTRVETVPPGAQPSESAAVLDKNAPAIVEIYLKEGTGEEQLAATVTVSDRGLIRRMDVSNLPISADVNQDTKTDLTDHALVKSAITGPAAPNPVPCDPRDVNHDGHVDLKDFSELQRRFEPAGG